jgi:hypothetical protein
VALTGRLSRGLHEPEDHVKPTRLEIHARWQDERGDTDGSRATVSMWIVANHQRELGCFTHCAERNMEQTRVRFLNAVFERQRVTVDEMIESAVNEVRRRS